MTHKKCDLCEVTKKVFGNRFDSCLKISNDMARAAVDLIKQQQEDLLKELEVAKANLSTDEYQLMKATIIRSFPFAAGQVPALTTISGAEVNPPQMMKLVQDNMTLVVSSVLQQTLKTQGPQALVELLMSLSPEPTETPAEPSIDPKNMN